MQISSRYIIQFVLHPRFSLSQVQQLDNLNRPSIALDGTQYIPGCVGLNNIKNNDFINVIVQCLAHVTPIRNFFMIEENYSEVKSPLVHTFGELIRKMWNPRNFKGHVSPHELLQVTLCIHNIFMSCVGSIHCLLLIGWCRCCMGIVCMYIWIVCWCECSEYYSDIVLQEGCVSCVHMYVVGGSVHKRRNVMPSHVCCVHVYACMCMCICMRVVMRTKDCLHGSEFVI